MVYLGLQGPLGVREGLGRAPEAHVGADIIPAGLAERALTAREAYLESHQVTWNEGVHACTDGRDRTARLVAQRQRLAHQDVAVTVVVEVVQIGAAEPRSLDGHLHLAGAWGRDAPLLLAFSKL